MVTGCGRFLDHGRVLLGGLVHLVDRSIDLGQRGCLFLGRGADLVHQIGNLGHTANNIRQYLARLAHQLHAILDLLARGRDQGFDLLGRIGRPLGQSAHLGGHHGKAPTSLPCPCRLDASIQCQKIGLESDLVDHTDDAADLVGRGLDFAHGHDRIGHHLAAADRILFGGIHDMAGLLRAFGGTFHRHRNLVQRRRRLLQGCGLTLGTAGQVIRRAADLVGPCAHHADVFGHFLHGLFETGHRRVEVCFELGIVAGEVLDNARRQITIGQTGQRLRRGFHHAFLDRLGLSTDRLGFSTGRFCRFQIDGNDEIHIQQRSLDHGPHCLAQCFAAI